MGMSSLAEIEDAADALTPEQKQELFLFLAARLRTGAGQTLPPRDISREQIEGWIADDEVGMRQCHGAGTNGRADQEGPRRNRGAGVEVVRQSVQERLDRC
jgi:hypothetical protein